MTDQPIPDAKSVPTPIGDSDRVSRLSSAGMSGSNAMPPINDAEFYEESDENIRRIESDRVPYREPYRPRSSRVDMPSEASELPFAMGSSRRTMPHYQRPPVNMNVSDDERLWAAVAHASAWITLFGGIISIGAIVPVSIFIPLVIYFLFRKKSEFVAYHALQAFVVQLLGTVGVALLLTAGGVVWLVGLVVAFLSVLLLVGFVLVPLWLLVGLIVAVGAALMPLVMVVFATIGALETLRGRDYRYPVIGRWIDTQSSGNRDMRYYI